MSKPPRNWREAHWALEERARTDPALPIGQDEPARRPLWASPIFGFLLVLLCVPLCVHVVARWNAAPEAAEFQQPHTSTTVPGAKGVPMDRLDLEIDKAEAGAVGRRPYRGLV